MPLPIIFPGDEVTVLYRDGYADGPAEKRCLVVEVGGDFIDLQMADEPDGDIWSAMFAEEERGDWRLIDHHPAPKGALTEEDVR